MLGKELRQDKGEEIMLKAFYAGKNVKCENCGKTIRDKIITICSLAKQEEIVLCVDCFLGMNAEKVEKNTPYKAV